LKRDTTNYFAVGLFVLAGLGILFWVLLRTSSGTGDQDVYYTQYRNVAGLSDGTLVTYEGYVFGQVTGIEPMRTDQGIAYRVALEVSKDWKIPEDSVARIYSEGLLADTVVNISEGHAGEFLDPGELIKGEQGIDLFAVIGEVAGDFGDLSENSIRPLIESLSQTVQQVGGVLESRVPVILDDVDQLVGRLDDSATHLADILDDEGTHKAKRILNNVDQASQDLSELTAGLSEVKRDAQTLMAKLDGLVSDSGPDVRQAVADLRHILEQVSRYSSGVLQNMDDASRNMNEFSRQIRDNPGRLLGGSAPQDRGVQRAR
jgi:phospholipid/cholesterol/gamma-HCH transport system substrate-binding protein